MAPPSSLIHGTSFPGLRSFILSDSGRSQGFIGPDSSVLSVNLPPSDPYPLQVLLYQVRSSKVYCRLQRQARRASLGKTQHLPIYHPTSLRFGPPDIRPRFATPTRPPPLCHIVGSLFATHLNFLSLVQNLHT